MKFDHLSQFNDNKFDESVSFQDLLDKYLRYLKWFILSILIFPIISLVYLQFVSEKYEVSASILIKETEKGSSFTDLSSFEGFGLFGDGNNSLENEIQILKSRKLITNVVNELQLNIRYFQDDFPLKKEKFTNSPVSLLIDPEFDGIQFLNSEFEIKILSENSFAFESENDEKFDNLNFNEFFNANLGNDDNPIIVSVKIELNENFKQEFIGENYIVKVNSLINVVDNLMRRITIEPINTNLSKVISIKMEETVPEKGLAIINNLIEQYNADGINDQNLIAQSTIDFLDERIELISAELNAIEGTAEQFKSVNKMVNTKDNANYYLESSSMNERDLVKVNTELQLVNYMLDELLKRQDYELLPGNIGLSDPGIITLIGEYNDLVLQRNRVLKSSSVRNPIIVGIDGQLSVLKINLENSLNNVKSSSQIQLSALNKQSGSINTKIATIPKNEREYKDIVRKQETKNALYLFMMQKREESILSNAVSIDKAKVIDKAYTNWLPISPKKGLIYFASVLLGFLVPFLVIYIKNFLDTKIQDESDISFLKIPHIGDIPISKDEKVGFIMNGDNSNIAEAFRYIRTNLGFMLDRKRKGKTIFVTSTKSGEGKTFTAINLAHSLAISGRKTLLIEMDLRVPKIAKYLNLKKKFGVSNFIRDSELSLDKLIRRNSDLEGLDILSSGDIPPNPVELLMSERIEKIFEFAKKEYDYVIVDTAPVGMVTDTIQISQFSDLTIYVVKANFLDKRMLHIPKKLFDEEKLVNMCFLINGADNEKKKYGYGYGYGTELKRKKFLWF